MNITVINGSPKGEYSITLQTAKYLQALFPAHTFTYINAGSKIKKYEKDFSEAAKALENAELILFCYPVYTFLVPSQLHRFLELIFENKVELTQKYVSQITTSKHFYDITAHRFLQEVCHDLGMRVFEGLSADMEELLSKKGRMQARKYFEHLLFSIQNDITVSFAEKSSVLPAVLINDCTEVLKTDPGTVCIVTDLLPEDTELNALIKAFRARLPIKTNLVNLREFAFSGGCLGCLKCAASGKCVYKDGFDSFLREHIQTADAIVYAFTVKNHSMGSLFKTYDDRQFCNGHRTVTAGKPVAYLINGDLSEEENLMTVINGRSQTGGNYLAGIVTNRASQNNELNALIVNLRWALQNGYSPEANFLGAGGMKIFRDLIYTMRGFMRLDHRFYKEHGLYKDLPQKKPFTSAFMYLAGAALSNEKIVQKMGNKMNEGMLMPYQKVIADAKKELMNGKSRS